jgi:hypothetical protein
MRWAVPVPMPSDLQDAYTFRKLLSHLPLGRAVDLRPAQLHALSNRSLEAGFDSLADHRPLQLSEGAGAAGFEMLAQVTAV